MLNVSQISLYRHIWKIGQIYVNITYCDVFSLGFHISIIIVSNIMQKVAPLYPIFILFLFCSLMYFLQIKT